MKEQKLICPECGKEVVTMLAHVKAHHDDIYNKADFYRYYPTYQGPLHLEKREKKDLECPLCHKHYIYNNGLMLHMKRVHNEYYNEHYTKDTRKLATLECPICHKMQSDMKQHAKRKHHLDWQDFCDQTQWNVSLTKYIDDEYRKHLSDNKKIFYNETERGKELRENQSYIWSKNNPAKDRETISKSIYTRSINGKIPDTTYRGITCHIDDMRFRSFNEYTFYEVCISQNVPIVYESNKYIIRYFNTAKGFLSTYLPDFYIDGVGLIELKPDKRLKEDAEDQEKYQKAAKIYQSIGIPFRICSLKEAFELVKISLRPYQIREIMKQVTLKARNERRIHFWLDTNHSAKMESIFGKEWQNEECITLKTHKCNKEDQ